MRGGRLAEPVFSADFRGPSWGRRRRSRRGGVGDGAREEVAARGRARPVAYRPQDVGMADAELDD